MRVPRQPKPARRDLQLARNIARPLSQLKESQPIAQAVAIALFHLALAQVCHYTIKARRGRRKGGGKPRKVVVGDVPGVAGPDD